MDKQMKARLGWVELYRKTGDAGLTYRRCGISRPTLRLWLRRYEADGIEGLRTGSKRPKRSPNRKRKPAIETRILDLRSAHNLGARRIQSELLWNDDISRSLATIQKVLTQAKVKPLKRPLRRKHSKRYVRPIADERVQMDTCKLAAGVYQYTAIDDCSAVEYCAFIPAAQPKTP